MKITINFAEPVIPEETVCNITPSDLDDFYVTASDFDKSNLFFILLTSLHHYEDRKDYIKAAHLNFLTAYYLFITLTPPGSFPLALHYIKAAIAFNPLPDYKEWLALIEKGN